MVKFNTFINREGFMERHFDIKVAYPKDSNVNITPTLLYNLICGGTNFIECEVREVTNANKNT